VGFEPERHEIIFDSCSPQNLVSVATGQACRHQLTVDFDVFVLGLRMKQVFKALVCCMGRVVREVGDIDPCLTEGISKIGEAGQVW